MRQFEVQLKAGCFNIRMGEGRFFYTFHFTIEQVLDTGEVEGGAGKMVLNKPLA